MKKVQPTWTCPFCNRTGIHAHYPTKRTRSKLKLITHTTKTGDPCPGSNFTFRVDATEPLSDTRAFRREKRLEDARAERAHAFEKKQSAKPKQLGMVASCSRCKKQLRVQITGQHRRFPIHTLRSGSECAGSGDVVPATAYV